MLSGAYGLHVAGLIPLSQGSSEIEASLSSRLAALEADASRVGENMGARISDLQSQVEALPGASGLSEDVGSEIATLRSDLNALEERIESGATAGSGEGADLSGLKSEVADLQASLASLKGSAEASGEVSKSIEGLQTSLGKLVNRVDSVEATAKAVQTAVSTSDTSLNTLSDSQERASKALATLSSDVQSVSSRVAANQKAIEEQLDVLSKRLAAVEATMGDATARELAARALSIAALKSAVDSGRSYEAELAAVRAGLPKDMDLTALTAHAESGVSPTPALIAEFPQVARKMFAAITRPDRDGDVLSSFLSGAKSLIAVRGPGDTSGEGPEADLRRMENAVSNADLEAALAAYEKLPDGAKQAGADWAERAKARVAVDDLTRKTSDEVLHALASRDS